MITNAYKLNDLWGDIYYTPPPDLTLGWFDVGYGKSYGTHYGILAQQLPDFAQANPIWALDSPSNTLEISSNIETLGIGYGSFYGTFYGSYRYFQIPPLSSQDQPRVYIDYVSLDLFGTLNFFVPISVINWGNNGAVLADDMHWITTLPGPLLLARDCSMHNDYSGFGIEVNS